MSARDKVASCLAEIVGSEIAQPMADRHIKKYLMEKGKTELADNDLSSADFGNWLSSRLQHLSMFNPQAIEALSSKLKEP